MRLKFKNIWQFDCFDRNGGLLWTEKQPNLVVNEGLTNVLNVMFVSGTQSTNWYILLFNSDSTPAAGWTYALGGTNFTEFTSYDESTRGAWGPSTATTPSISDSASFTASTAVSTTIYGAALVNVSTKGDNASGTGVMWCATRFGTARPFNDSEVLQVSYTINSQDV